MSIIDPHPQYSSNASGPTEACRQYGGGTTEPADTRTWKPGTAGAIAICVGISEVTLGLGSVANPYVWNFIHWGLATYLLGLMAIPGGILAVERRAWRLALTGAICSLLASFVVPLLAINAMTCPRIPGAEYAPMTGLVLILGVPLLTAGMLAVACIARSKREFR